MKNQLVSHTLHKLHHHETTGSLGYCMLAERVVASTDAALKRTQQATKHVEDAAASQKQSSCAIM